MPYIYDRVKETTTTAGTGAVTLAGAVTGYRAFSSVLNAADRAYYVIEDPTAGTWECGNGTYSTTGFSRTTVTASSNSNNAVNFAANSKYIYLDATGSCLGTATRTASVVDSTNVGASDGFIINHDTTATPVTNFGVQLLAQLKSSTTSNQTAGVIKFFWTDATHATRNGAIQLIPYRIGSGTPVIDCQGGLFGNVLGFFGATPVQVQNQVDVNAALSNYGLATGTLTLNATTLRYQIPNNPIDNANFNVWQRGTSFASVADGTYTADRWKYNKTSSCVHTISQDTSVPTVAAGSAILSNYSLKANTTTADASIAAGDYAYISQTIEGFDWANFAQQPFVLSFWAKCSQNGTLTVAFRNSGNDRSYLAEYNISGIGSWNYIYMVVTASPSAGTWNYTTGTGLNIAFTLNCGSTFQTTAGSWQTGNFLGTSNSMNLTASVNDYLQISQVNLIMNSSPYSGLGTVLPMIQPISYKDDLARCQRYFNTYSGSPIGISLNGGRTYNDGVLYFPTEMRSSPSLQSGASYSVNAGVPGTVSAGTNTKIAELTNSDNNWTANAIVSFTGSFSADF